MEQGMHVQPREATATRVTLRLRVAVGAAAIVVASFVAAPLAAASTPQVARTSGNVATASLVTPGFHAGGPTAFWPRWGGPRHGAALAAEAAPSQKGGPVDGATHGAAPGAFWPRWGGPQGDELVAARTPQAFWPRWGGPVR